MTIEKSQDNYETLSGSLAPVFLILQAKRDIIAYDPNVTTGSIVVKAPTPRLSAPNRSV